MNTLSYFSDTNSNLNFIQGAKISINLYRNNCMTPIQTTKYVGI